MVQIKSDKVSDYELKRLKQIAENSQQLTKLGIQPRPLPPIESSRPTKTKSVTKTIKKKQQPVRPQSNRYSLRGRDALVKTELLNISSFGDGDTTEDRVVESRYPAWTKGNVFGPIPGIPVGAEWDSRMGSSYCGVHRPTVAGIHGSTEEGCYSLAISGGYEDDIDEGETFTYTGSGGRDLKGTKAKPKNLRTAPQTSDQEFIKHNLALKISFETKKPIRVIRGYKNRFRYAPLEGYRYDGLYKVTKVWREPGKSGYLICRFKLQRLPNQPPLIIRPKIEE